MAELKAVLFDMGDTIVDLGEGRGSYEERVRQRAGRVYEALAALDATLGAAPGAALGEREAFCEALAVDSEAQYQAALAEQRGIDIFAVMRQFLRKQSLPAEDGYVVAAGEAYCRTESELATPLRTGAIETLAALKARGLTLAVVSNTVQPGRFLSSNTQRWGLSEFFDARVYSSDVGVAKPHPEIFRIALERLGARAENAVYVGDRLVPDVAGPHAAGLKAVLIEVGHRVESHADIVPDARVKELPELLRVLPILFQGEGYEEGRT